jgi:putative addiction module component (TIGR02574 family)
MTANARKLLKEALKLPAEARAAVAGSLLRSLHGRMDEEVEAAWIREIERRAADVDTGKVPLIPWSEVRKKLRQSPHART